ncbi:hypothetical protein DF052_09565 [Burkholderia glumae]|nr:hypothetical protein NCPPB3923_07145 [Burkholderia glumae]PJO20961.1 hypothetical protein Y5A_021955 [Burkholderia glumae AU6208]PNL05286.1 hypothetical protein CEQ24_005025 [Burkholderia glumae]RQZ74221.1 hypothetical protein DF052_09565 [Burkholderia glumae]
MDSSGICVNSRSSAGRGWFAAIAGAPLPGCASASRIVARSCCAARGSACSTSPIVGVMAGCVTPSARAAACGLR